MAVKPGINISLLIMALVCLASELSARTWYMTPGDSMPSVLAQMDSGDTLLISNGTYLLENTVIEKPLVLIGVDFPVFHAAAGGEILTVIADSVSVIGIEFQGVKTNYLKENAAIHLKNGKHCVVSNNRIIKCFFGIYLEHTSFTTVMNNYIEGKPDVESASGNAIHAWYCTNLLLDQNELLGHRDGIYFEFVHESEIKNNTSRKNTRYGLHFMFSNDDVYSDNRFVDNGVGVAVMFSNRIVMRNNLFKDNWGRSAYGLLLKEIRDGVIENNYFDYNTIGIYVEGSSRINYERNTFERNGCSMTISGGCEENNIRLNNFINNHLDFEIHGSIHGNIIEGNYWSSYSGYDLDKDNVGDVPHYPVKLFSHVLGQAPETIVLMRSLLVDIINFAESVSPIFTPVEVRDPLPSLQPIK